MSTPNDDFFSAFQKLWGHGLGPDVRSVFDALTRPEDARELHALLKRAALHEGDLWKRSDAILAYHIRYSGDVPSGWMLTREALVFVAPGASAQVTRLELARIDHIDSFSAGGLQLIADDGSSHLLRLYDAPYEPAARRLIEGAPSLPDAPEGVIAPERLTADGELWFGNTRDLYDILLTHAPGSTGLSTEWLIANLFVAFGYLGALLLRFFIVVPVFLAAYFLWPHDDIPTFNLVITSLALGVLTLRLHSKDDLLRSWSGEWGLRRKREPALHAALEVLSRLAPWIDPETHESIDFRFEDTGDRWLISAPLRDGSKAQLFVLQHPRVLASVALIPKEPEDSNLEARIQPIRWPRGLESHPRELHVTPGTTTRCSTALLTSDWARERPGAALGALLGAFLEATVPGDLHPDADRAHAVRVLPSSQAEIAPVPPGPQTAYAVGYASLPIPSFRSSRRRMLIKVVINVVLTVAVPWFLTDWLSDGDLWTTLVITLTALLCLRLSLIVPTSQPPDRAGAAPPDLTLHFDGDRLTLGEHTIALDEPFAASLTRDPDAHVLGLELRQQSAAKGSHRLRIAVPLTEDLDDDTLETYVVKAPTFRADDLERWIWPLLRTRAAAHGRDLPWRVTVEEITS